MMIFTPFLMVAQDLSSLPPELLFIVVIVFVIERSWKAWQDHQSGDSKDRRTWEERLRDDFKKEIDEAVQKSEVHCSQTIETIKNSMEREIDALKEQLVRALAELSNAKAWEQRAWQMKVIALTAGVDQAIIDSAWLTEVENPRSHP